MGETTGKTQAPAGITIIVWIAQLYAVGAVGIALLSLFIIISSIATGGGGGAMILPLGAVSGTEAAELIDDPLAPDAHFTGVEFSAPHGLSASTEFWFYLPRVLVPVLHAICAFGLAALAASVGAGTPFSRRMIRIAVVVGVSLITLGFAIQWVAFWGIANAQFEILGETSLYGGTRMENYDWTPVAAGAAVLLFAAILKQGARLQRDTEGLV